MRLRICVALSFVGLAMVVIAAGRAGGVESDFRSLQGRIAFAHEFGNGAPNSAVFVIDADGGTARSLMPGRRGGAPTWSPDGRRLAFLRLGGVWLMNGDGSDERILARVQFPSFPIWSPDGRRIAFQVGDRTGEKTRLAVVNSDGSGLQTLAAADLSVSWPNGRPSWSPDGKWIAFRGGKAIRVVRQDGSEQRIVSQCSTRACLDPSWSPDGRSLLFSGDNGMVIVEHPTTADRVGRILIRNGFDQAWSPDGRTIVFERDNTIQIMNADGSNRRRLTSGHNPVWSPDGKALAFLRLKDPNDPSWKIYTIHVNGTRERLLAENATVDFPDWGP